MSIECYEICKLILIGVVSGLLSILYLHLTNKKK
jgi:hypothetical protein